MKILPWSKKTQHHVCIARLQFTLQREEEVFYSTCKLNIREENWQVQHKSIFCLESLIGLYTSKRIIKLLQEMSLWEKISQEIQQERSIGMHCSSFPVLQESHSFVTSDAKFHLSPALTRTKHLKIYSKKSTIKWEMFWSLRCVFQYTESPSSFLTMLLRNYVNKQKKYAVYFPTGSTVFFFLLSFMI